MELASRVFDVVTAQPHRHKATTNIYPEVEDELRYWRRVLRMAALCHDIGHLPFSHAAEQELLPEGWDHERLTVALIRSKDMQRIWSSLRPPLDPEHIAKLAVGPKKMREASFTDWEAILAEIIVGDAFGVDRIDYLLRDSHHSGVAYGKFDHYRLVDCLRVLPKSYEGSAEPALGIQDGGLHTAEALLLARYFMYTQVYFHSVRRIYNIHLQDFMRAWLGQHGYPVDLEGHLNLTDNEALVEIRKAAQSKDHPGHDHARRIVERDHFRILYQRNPEDFRKNPDAASAIFKAACEKFPTEALRFDSRKEKGESLVFPVETKDGRIASSLETSDVLENLPLAAVDFVFIDRAHLDAAREWLDENRDNIIEKAEEDET
jgi:HD superfamily phosphohydrolase